MGLGVSGQDEGIASPPQEFDPSVYGAVRAWYSSRFPADLTVAGDDNVDVDAWADHSGHVGAATAAGNKRPNFGWFPVNRMPVVTYRGDQDVSVLPSGLYNIAAGDFTIYIPFIAANTGVVRSFLTGHVSSAERLRIARENGGLEFQCGNATLYWNGYLALEDTNLHSIAVRRQGTNMAIFFDGELVATGTGATNVTVDSLTLGLDGLNRQPKAQICEYIVFGEAVENSDIEALDQEVRIGYWMQEQSITLSISPQNPEEDDVVTYTIAGRDNNWRWRGSLTLSVEGDLTDGDFDDSFLGALQDAVDVTAGVTLAGNVLTFTDAFTGTLSWSRVMTAASTAEIHGVRITASSTLFVETPFSAVITGAPAGRSRTTYNLGHNQAGAEFEGYQFWDNGDDPEIFASYNYSIVRIPFRWEHLQPVNYGPLDDDIVFELENKVEDFLDLGFYVIIDPHNYAHKDGHPIGSSEVPISAFIDFWLKLASIGLFRNNPKVIFLSVNEPSGEHLDATVWRGAQKTWVDELRAADINNELMIAGIAFTGAHSWESSGNAAMYANFQDPQGNLTIDMHQYLDGDSSGQAGVCTVGSGGRLDNATTWGRTNGHKLFLGEFAFGDFAIEGQEDCEDEGPALLRKMASNKDVWTGGTWWASGPWPEEYMFKLLDADGEPKPVMEIYQAFVDREYLLTIPNLVHFADSADPIDDNFTLASGAISVWKDLSGHGNNWEQATSGMRYTVAANAINGKPAVDGTGKTMLMNSALNNFGAGSLTFFATHKWKTTPAGDRWVIGANGPVFMYYPSTSTFTGLVRSDSYNGSNVAVTMDNNVHVGAVFRSGVNVRSAFDGARGANYTGGQNRTGQLVLGAFNGGETTGAWQFRHTLGIARDIGATSDEANRIGRTLARMAGSSWTV